MEQQMRLKSMSLAMLYKIKPSNLPRKLTILFSFGLECFFENYNFVHRPDAQNYNYLHLYCNVYNVSAGVSVGLLQMFLVDTRQRTRIVEPKYSFHPPG